MEAFRIIEAPSGSSGSAFCTVKSKPFYIDVEGQVIELLGYLAEGSILRHTGIGEYDIELTLLARDLCEQAIKIAKVRHVSSHAGYISTATANSGSRRPVMKTCAPSFTNCFAVAKANAAIATGNECDFSFKPVHVFHSSDQNYQIARTTLPKGRLSTGPPRAST
jgi:hypothetical protein